jgi:hypothetical protein
MTKNVGTIDRLARIAIGLGLLCLVFVGPQTLWGLLGLVPLLSGLTGFCPMYRALGLSTRGKFTGTTQDQEMAFLNLFLRPGDLVCDATGVPPESDHRQILRSFVNMLFWGAVSVALALWLLL